MAEVGSVYDCTPVPRDAEDILAGAGGPPPPKAGPCARGKWLVASVTADAAEVIGQVFDEFTRRDPEHHRRWVVLVDGNPHQIDRTHEPNGCFRASLNRHSEPKCSFWSALSSP